VREPLFAAWITALSNNDDLITKYFADIEGILNHYHWSKLYTSTFFVAECVYYQLEKNKIQKEKYKV